MGLALVGRTPRSAADPLVSLLRPTDEDEKQFPTLGINP